jgi:hypothetical protein
VWTGEKGKSPETVPKDGVFDMRVIGARDCLIGCMGRLSLVTFVVQTGRSQRRAV